MKKACRNQRGVSNRKILDLRSEYLKENREIRNRLDYMSKHLDKLWEQVTQANERLQELEIYMNIVSRLLTTVCIDKIGIKMGNLKLMLKKIQDEAIADSQVSYLEELYRLDESKGERENKRSHPEEGS